jgi:carbon monoxide dehydrogenase subunit G
MKQLPVDNGHYYIEAQGKGRPAGFADSGLRANEIEQGKYARVTAVIT